ncbi:MAG: alpha/beta hydrolase family esterase [Candidatus Nanopelagicales bacterium]
MTALVAALLLLGGLVGLSAPPSHADVPGVLNFGGLDRTYLVHVPPGPPAGLVINLHGAGQNGAQQAGLTGYDGVADGYGFVVAYPDGIDASWADGRGASVPDRQGIDDVGFLAALIDKLSRDYAVPPGRVFVTGMSAGAFMATRLACDRADLISAIAPVAGTLGSGVGCAPSRPVSVMQIAGTADPVVPFGGGPMVGRGGASDIVSAPAMVERWRGIDGCPGPLIGNVSNGAAQFLTAGGCAGNTAVVLVRLDGAGHTWPAGRFALPEAIVGPTSYAVDGSQATAQFFAAH